VRLCGAALDCALLLVSDDPRFFQVIGEERGTAHELAMVPGVLGTYPNEVRDRAAAGEQDIGHLRIAAINDNGGAQIGIGALIFLNYLGDINAPRTVSELGRKGYLIATDSFVSRNKWVRVLPSKESLRLMTLVSEPPMLA
jgi:hypothetical protein